MSHTELASEPLQSNGPYALGKAPSKDTLWTTVNGYTAIPGCGWTPDHEAPAAETHLVLALLSTGSVGGWWELAMECCVANWNCDCEL